MKKTLTTVAALAIATPAALAETQLTYGSWAPSTDPASQAMDQFVAEVEAASGGSVTFETHYDSTVVKMRTVLGSIGDGLVDVGYIAGAIYQAEMPIDSMITQYSSIKANPLSISAAVTDFVLNDCPDCLAEAAGHGVRALAYAGTPQFYLMCKNPISGFEDLEDKSIRAASANLRLVEFIGATPVNTPTVEVMDSMQRGQVECAVASSFWLQAYSLWDVVEYIVDLPVGQYNNGLVFGISEDVWQDMDAADRQIVLDALPTLVTQTAANGMGKAAGIREEAISRGVVWAEPTEAMRATMEAWFAQERASVQAWGEGKSIADPAAILDGFEAAVAKWNAIVEDAGNDPALVRERLVQDVYSRL